jgi:hypothetical protein
MDLLKLTIEILERPTVPADIVRIVDELFTRNKDKPIHPGTAQWNALLGTIRSIARQLCYSADKDLRSFAGDDFMVAI